MFQTQFGFERPITCSRKSGKPSYTILSSSSCSI